MSKFNAAGSATVYSRYLGGSGDDIGRAIAVDAAGNAYVAGLTESTNFPTANPLQPVNAGGSDAFVTKLNAAGSTLVFSTYLGGNGADHAVGIAVDTSGNVYLVGRTDSLNFPLANPFQVASAGNGDAFVTKLNAAGSALVYSSYLGGSDSDVGRAIAVDSSGNAYLTGNTASTNFPTTNPAQPANGGGSDAFVTKVAAETPTAVSVHSFAATRTGRSVVLRWRSDAGAALLGFHVYRHDSTRRVRLFRCHPADFVAHLDNGDRQGIAV